MTPPAPRTATEGAPASALPSTPASAPPAGPHTAPGWEAFRPAVEREVRDFFASSRRRARTLSPSFARLWEVLEESVAGGKWMRPRLVHLAYTAFGGTDPAACARLGAAFEVLHAALVVHDDVIDRDFVRRGRPTVGAVYRDQAAALGRAPAEAEHAGHSAAIIAGDLLLAGSLRLSAAAGGLHPAAGAVADVVHEAVFASAAGELEDLLFSLAPDAAELQEVLDMERLKTAAYSFEAPLKAGALLAGAAPAQAAALAGVGRRIGVAYQVVDDVLGTFGEPATTGKSVESDLREGKRTVLTAYAAGQVEFEAALAAFRRGEAGLDRVRQALRRGGAEAHALDLAAGLVSAALELTAALELDPPLRTELTRICNHILTRER